MKRALGYLAAFFIPFGLVFFVAWMRGWSGERNGGGGLAAFMAVAFGTFGVWLRFDLTE